MTTVRTVGAEILDGLAPDNPRARRSRADLRRINGLMLNDRVVARLLRASGARRILEIGAGDGAFARRVFASPLGEGREGVPSIFSERRQGTGCPTPVSPRGEGGLSELVLLDLQPFPTVEISGWGVKTVAADAFDYLADPNVGPFDAIVANLFLHHFEDERLADLLRLVANRTDLFVACEPRRSALALSGTRFLGAIGCNDVTRHDARVSVLGGFRAGEITKLWPARGWRVEERSALPFGHAFRAVRVR